MSYVVARWWTFNEPVIPYGNLIRLLYLLTGARAEDLRISTFDGRRYHKGTFDSSVGIDASRLPPRYCGVEVGLGRARNSNQYIDGFAATLSVSPTSPVWAPMTKQRAKNSKDLAAAMSVESVQDYVKVNRVTTMPHLLEGWAVPPRKIDRAEQLAQVVAWLSTRDISQGSTAGGVDFVSKMAEMGSYDIVSLLSSDPSTWEKLDKRFDDMHKVMFGPPAMFHQVPKRLAASAFERMELIVTPTERRIVAVARTGKTMRKFFRRPDDLVIDVAA